MARKAKADDRQVMLAPNKMIDFDDKRIPYPNVYGSRKYDGNRCFVRWDGAVLTRGMIEQPNKNLPIFLKGLRDIATEGSVCFDCEIILPSATHHGANTKIFNSHDKPIPKETKVYVFDCIGKDQWENCADDPDYGQDFAARTERLSRIFEFEISYNFETEYVQVEQIQIHDADQAREFFEQSLAEGYEGIMLRAMDGKYKSHARCGHKGAWLLKFKAEETLDGQILEVVQMRKMKEGLKRTKNAFGRTEQPTKNDANYDYQDAAAAFLVRTEDGVESRIMFAEGVADMPQRQRWWKDRKKLIGRWVEFKHFACGAKDGIRSGRMIGFRDDKEKK